MVHRVFVIFLVPLVHFFAVLLMMPIVMMHYFATTLTYRKRFNNAPVVAELERNLYPVTLA